VRESVNGLFFNYSISEKINHRTDYLTAFRPGSSIVDDPNGLALLTETLLIRLTLNAD